MKKLIVAAIAFAAMGLAGNSSALSTNGESRVNANISTSGYYQFTMSLQRKITTGWLWATKSNTYTKTFVCYGTASDMAGRHDYQYPYM